MKTDSVKMLSKLFSKLKKADEKITKDRLIYPDVSDYNAIAEEIYLKIKTISDEELVLLYKQVNASEKVHENAIYSVYLEMAARFAKMIDN